MDLEGIMLSEIIQRQIPYDLTYMLNLRNKTNKTKGKQAHRQNKLVVARERGFEEGRQKR